MTCVAKVYRWIKTLLFEPKKKHMEYLKLNDREFQALFGICKQTLYLLWEHLSLAENSSKIEHLLYMLHFFKQYQTEDAAAIFWKVTPKTLRKHTWNTIEIFHRTLHTVRK